MNGKSKQASEIPRDGRLVRKFGVRKKKRDVMLQSFTLNVNFIVYFTYFRENVVVIICTNINYNCQPYIEDDFDWL